MCIKLDACNSLKLIWVKKLIRTKDKPYGKPEPTAA